MTGYEIKGLLDQALSHFWSESFGSIYPALALLERKGMIRRARAGVPHSRNKQFYELTGIGRREWNAWLLSAPRPDARPRSELLLKLFFGKNADPGALRRMVEDFLALQRGTLVALQELAGAIEAEADEDDRFFWHMTVRRGIAVAEARIAWADESLRALDARLMKRERRPPADGHGKRSGGRARAGKKLRTSGRQRI